MIFYINTATNEIKTKSEAYADIEERISCGDYEDRLAETIAEWLGISGEKKALRVLYRVWLKEGARSQIFDTLVERLFAENYEPIPKWISNPQTSTPDAMSEHAALCVLVDRCLESGDELAKTAAKKILKKLAAKYGE